MTARALELSSLYPDFQRLLCIARECEEKNFFKIKRDDNRKDLCMIASVAILTRDGFYYSDLDLHPKSGQSKLFHLGRNVLIRKVKRDKCSIEAIGVYCQEWATPPCDHCLRELVSERDLETLRIFVIDSMSNVLQYNFKQVARHYYLSRPPEEK